MKRLGAFFATHEDWLIDRAVHHARASGHAADTSTLREAWRASIRGLSEPLNAALDAGDAPQMAMRPAIAFGVEEALRHRARGIEPAAFLGLLKLYRRSYRELVEEKLAETAAVLARLDEMFDAIEISVVEEWTRAGESEEHAALAEKNRRLANEKNKYLTVFESLAEPVLLIDAAGRPLHVNAAANRLITGDASPGAGYYGAIDDARIAALVGEILAASERAGGRITIETASGSLTFVVAVEQMLDISGKFAGRVIILSDVTRLTRALDEAEGADRAKSAFLATVSHELKTPISAIAGLARLIDTEAMPPVDRRHLEAIRASVATLAELTENMLGLSLIEARALRRLDQDFDLCATVDGLMPLFAPDATARGLEVRAVIEEDVPCMLRGDEAKLVHVLMNLISNAVKYTASGSVTLRVSLAPEARPEAPLVVFAVADTGVGLPAGETGWLFDAFSQYVHPAAEAPIRGSGLGLAICKRMVDFLGGSITAEPNPGGGSLFTVTLPFALARQANEAEAAGLAVLVVEDDPASAIVAEGYLRQLGHAPHVVHGIAEALAALAGRHFDLVLTDHRLGAESGLDLARALREGEAWMRALPIILMSAAVPDLTSGTGATPWIDLILEKPFSRSVLGRAIRQATARRAVEEEAPDAPDAPDAPVLDHRALNQLITDLGYEQCERVMARFLDTLPGLRASMRAAIQRGDFAATAEAAHQLISASGYVGLDAVAKAARALHGACTRREAGPARALQARLDGLCEDAEAEIEAFRKKARDDYHAEFN